MNDSINKKKQTSLLNQAQQNNPPPLNFDGNITEELKEILAKKKSKKGKGYNSYTYYQSKRREGDKKWQELTKKEQEEWKSKAILENEFHTLRLKYKNNSIWDIRDGKPLEFVFNTHTQRRMLSKVQRLWVIRPRR